MAEMRHPLQCLTCKTVFTEMVGYLRHRKKNASQCKDHFNKFSYTFYRKALQLRELLSDFTAPAVFEQELQRILPYSEILMDGFRYEHARFYRKEKKCADGFTVKPSKFKARWPKGFEVPVFYSADVGDPEWLEDHKYFKAHGFEKVVVHRPVKLPQGEENNLDPFPTVEIDTDGVTTCK